MQVLVSPLARIGAVIARHSPSHMISLLDAATMIATPDGMHPDRHLRLGVNDIAEPADGLIVPALEHARSIVDFAGGWDRRSPMMIHCFAGISRSTAAAFVVLCALDPGRQELTIARTLRAAAPFAQPNRALVAHGDAVLGRDGRMTAAVEAMGLAVMSPEGRPFAMALGGAVSG